MKRVVVLSTIVAVVVIIMLLAAFVPAVGYRLSVSDPGFPYNMQGYRTCEDMYVKGHVINVSLPAFQKCVSQYLIPPINVTGRGSLLFSLAGLGVGPFPPLMTVGENEGPGEFYALLHMSGSKVLAAEQVPQMDLTYDPSGIVIQNTSLSEGFLGNANVTISVSNQSGQTLVNPWVQLSIPGDDGNFTDKDGIKWTFNYPSAFAQAALAPCEVNGAQSNLSSGATCSVTLNPIITALPGTSFRYSAEVRGYLGSKYSVTRQTFSYSLPSQVVNQLWMKTFIGLVNSARGGTALSESSTLDRFASLRFNTAVTQPDISDYGFYGDLSSFFGTNATKTMVEELLLFPGTESPYSFVSSLQSSFPAHWAPLMNGNYTHFGYFVETAPAVGVKLPCPTTEIPQGGVNITQYFMKLGCTVGRSPSTTWLVMILST
jgi:uncharacterized glyoxalase superfamily protein PhnB